MRPSGADLSQCVRWILGKKRSDPVFDPSGMDLPYGWNMELGKSFLDFAQWAFGPTGIRSLRLLAYGDFSYSLRFKPTLLRRREVPCRSEDNNLFLRFDELRVGENQELWELWELYEQELHFLTACPTDTLMHVS
ncbi:uncharacterized protein DNG_00173 [Cephalotrichum gorgonifer]|uniref:Uncharacterized protein n=1 Tax=Cephalotrichum gorgonifer TaxID=2041049 RepID=A0AAE8MPU9_9PEZI|nr:uncharacterized protein DNG_00173 [Cephalotrichum gorgonifer]